jgi:hypothetical protein
MMSISWYSEGYRPIAYCKRDSIRPPKVPPLPKSSPSLLAIYRLCLLSKVGKMRDEFLSFGAFDLASREVTGFMDVERASGSDLVISDCYESICFLD